ncbi:hypothetical protein [Streptomyces griseorubiginosus]|uniref:hypothetical protein n=1 Tax=Streptomyces griseorubiginosus TaxID=67304 RepID=UPI00332A1BD3
MSESNGYRLRWQQDAHRVLGGFLAEAREQNLPALSWTIATSGALVGDVDSLNSTPDGMRAAFEAWTGWLNARGVTDRMRRDGVTHLYAQFRRGEGATEVRGAIRADIHPPFDEERS